MKSTLQLLKTVCLKAMIGGKFRDQAGSTGVMASDGSP